MKKLFRALSIFLFVFVSTTHAFDYEKGSLPKLVNPELTYICITTIGQAEGMYYDYNDSQVKIKTGAFVLQGAGVVLNDGYILTVSHVVYPARVKLKKVDNYSFTVRADRVLHETKNIFISTGPLSDIYGLNGAIGAKIVYIDREADVAILKYDNIKHDYLIPSPYKISETKIYTFYGIMDRVTVSTPIFGIVYERNEENERINYSMEIREGKVIDNVPTSRVPDLKWSVDMNSFTVDMVVHGGDSGLPLMAWINKEIFIVGIIHSTEAVPPYGMPFPGGWSFIARPDAIKQYLDVVMKPKTGGP